MFNKYDAYKDSCVEWIGEIPVNWEVKRLKAVLAERNEKNDPIKTDNILSLTMHQGVIPIGEKIGAGGNKPKEDLSAYKLAYPDDIVLNSMNVIVGSVGLSQYFGAVSPVYYTLHLRYKENTEIRYYSYIFQAKGFQTSLGRLGTGILIKKSESSGKLNTIRMKISIENLNNEFLPLPTHVEQLGISNFLDKKTLEIDQAIAIKEQQIALLNERKQIVIQKAVTQGLNPNVAMKDSGVEWIGKIPEHWIVKKLKYVLQERSERSQDGLEPLLMMSQVHGLVIRSEYSEKTEVAATTVGNKLVYKNDLVFNKLKAHLGVFFSSVHDFVGCVSPDYAVYKSVNYIEDTKFLELLFRNPLYIKQFILRSSGIVEGLIRLYTTELFDLKIGIPPKDEQIAILKHIEEQSFRFDEAVKNYSEQIEKLKEYKTTLINDAVTGKIKVA